LKLDSALTLNQNPIFEMASKLDAGIFFKKEHPTSNIEHPTSNEKIKNLVSPINRDFHFAPAGCGERTRYSGSILMSVSSSFHSKFDVGRSMFDVHLFKLVVDSL